MAKTKRRINSGRLAATRSYSSCPQTLGMHRSVTTRSKSFSTRSFQASSPSLAIVTEAPASVSRRARSSSTIGSSSATRISRLASGLAFNGGSLTAAGAGSAAGPSMTGKYTRKRAPRSVLRDISSIRPPCSWTMPYETERPRPVPCP